ncbi:ribonuclease HII [Alphaproteobacteria bacterium LSUCC0684]
MAGKADRLSGPDFHLEEQALGDPGEDLFAAALPKMVIGIDEAGRGPWAGPVTAAAAWINPESAGDLPAGLNDSKTLSAKKRAALWRGLQELAENPAMFRVHVSSVDAATIDQMGILPATFRAMETALSGLGFMEKNLHVLVDGSLAPPFPVVRSAQSLTVQPVVKGDSRSLSIAAASIAAKETRDAIMRELDQSWPQYGWRKNMGYGTLPHAETLASQGPCLHHRLTFRPVARAAARHGYTR